MNLKDRNRIIIPLTGKAHISGNVHLVLDWELNRVEVHYTAEVAVCSALTGVPDGLDAGLTNILVGRTGLQIQSVSGINQRAKRLGRFNKIPVRNIDHFRSHFQETDTMAEIIDIYNDNMVGVGSKARDQVHRDGDWHKAFHCWIIYRRDGRDVIVVQRRGPDKDLYPNALDITAAGHYQAGETIADGLREVKEELGIDVPFASLISLGIRTSASQVGSIINREFNDVFLLVRPDDIADYHFDRDEVSGLVEVDIDAALDMCVGLRETIPVRAIMVDRTSPAQAIVEQQLHISIKDFVSSKDAYFYKILLIAKQCLNGEKHLII